MAKSWNYGKKNKSGSFSQKKKELSDCKNHEEVIILTSKWGFEIGKRWGEY